MVMNPQVQANIGVHVITGLDPVICRLPHMAATLERNLAPRPFWKEKKLWQMTPEEWESLCDGCARCCLVKLEDEDTGEIHFTSAACKLLDRGQCRCTDYDNRTARVPDCVQLTSDNVGELNWLPKTCAYRLLSEGRSLPWWHPLVSGRRETVTEAGISVAGRTRSEELFSEDELWTLRWRLPAARRKRQES